MGVLCWLLKFNWFILRCNILILLMIFLFSFGSLFLTEIVVFIGTCFLQVWVTVFKTFCHTVMCDRSFLPLLQSTLWSLMQSNECTTGRAVGFDLVCWKWKSLTTKLWSERTVFPMDILFIVLAWFVNVRSKCPYHFLFFLVKFIHQVKDQFDYFSILSGNVWGPVHKG